MIWKYSVEGKGVVFSMPKIRKIRQGFVWQPFVHYCIKTVTRFEFQSKWWCCLVSPKCQKMPRGVIKQDKMYKYGLFMSKRF